MEKILITDCWTRKALSLVRSLGKEGLELHTISHNWFSAALHSIYSIKYFIMPLPEAEPDLYMLKLIELLKEDNYSCLFALEEPTIELILKNREEIEQYCKLALPEKESYELANNKRKTIDIAIKAGVPTPKDYSYINEESLDTFKFPLIIKPCKSSGSRGLKLIKKKEDFIINYKIVKEKYEEVLIQEYIERAGEGLGVALLADRGEVKLSFSYKRLREYPVNGGPGTLNESTDDPLIKSYSAKLIKELNWTGVAMVEFKRDLRDNSVKLMEINPRFWGSLQLSAVCGINFPFLLYKQVKGEAVEQVEYRTGIRSRWILPGDLAHFIFNKKRFKLKPSFFDFFDKNTYYSQYDKTDCKGNISVVMCFFAGLFEIDNWKKGIFRR